MPDTRPSPPIGPTLHPRIHGTECGECPILLPGSHPRGRAVGEPEKQVRITRAPASHAALTRHVSSAWTGTRRRFSGRTVWNKDGAGDDESPLRPGHLSPSRRRPLGPRTNPYWNDVSFPGPVPGHGTGECFVRVTTSRRGGLSVRPGMALTGSALPAPAGWSGYSDAHFR